jgi:hypothetical protein
MVAVAEIPLIPVGLGVGKARVDPDVCLKILCCPKNEKFLIRIPNTRLCDPDVHVLV